LKCLIQVRQVAATIIFLKGVGGILFVFGSTFGSFLLVKAFSLSLKMNRHCHFSNILSSFDILLVLKYYNTNWVVFPRNFCSFHIWHLLLLFCMISTTTDLISPNTIYCEMSSFRYMQTLAYFLCFWIIVLSLWRSNKCVHFWLQNAALFGALLFFIGMKNSIPRKQLRKKTPNPKTKKV
jgi:hypothetical protein